MENSNLTNSYLTITMFSEDEKLIYFDSLETGYMSDADGEYHAYSPEKVYLNPDNDSVIRCQSKLNPLNGLGEKYDNIYITYIPAREFDYYYRDNLENSKLANPIHSRVLIKTSKTSDESHLNQIKCYLSGRRSAIIFDEFNRATRLKGCGNLFQGFNLENVNDLGNNHLEIRGAQFKNTCLRELYITNYVMDKCEKYGLICGNIPVGFHLYKNLPEGLLNEAELCDKYCGVYLTGGDKRLGSHFFDGLNYILSALFENTEYLSEFFGTSNHQADFNKITDYLPSKNFSFVNKENNTLNETIKIEFNSNILDNPLISKDKSQYKEMFFDYYSYLGSSTCDKDITSRLRNLEKKCLEELIKNLLEIPKVDIDSPIGFPEIILKNIIEKVFNICEKNHLNLFSSIVTLLSKISYEVGFVKNFFEEIDLNWGTFDYHCNAHLDNFIMLKNNSKKIFLAPLDFDLAFTRDQFVDLNYINAKGIENKLNFDDLLEREKNNLIIQMIGFNMIPNIEVKVLEFIKINNLAKENLLSLLKENNVEYFTQGYLKRHLSNEIDSFYELGCELVKLILVIETYSRKKN